MSTLLLDRLLARCPFPNPNLLALAEIGSKSHGTWLPPEEGGSDDVDLMGVLLPPAERIIGLEGWEHWVEMIDELDVTIFSLKKFVGMLAKGNPNVLPMLWLDDHLILTPQFERLKACRDDLISVQTAKAFAAYASGQRQRIKKDTYQGYMGERRKALVEKHGYDVKFVSHTVRLLNMAIDLLRQRILVVKRPDAELYRQIKRGEWSFETLQTLMDGLELEVSALINTSLLPPKANPARLNQCLVDLTREWIAQ